MEISIALACVALAAATFIFVFYFDRQEDGRDLLPHRSRLDQLLERRDAIYENLRDLRFEHRAGKYSDADYQELKTALETEAALVLAEIEKETGATTRPLRRTPPPASPPA
jgi:hypothetical protein